MNKTITRIAVYMAVSFITYMALLVLVMMTLLVVTAFNGA